MVPRARSAIPPGRTKIIFKVETITPKWMSFIEYAAEDQIKKNAGQVRGSVRDVPGATHKDVLE